MAYSDTIRSGAPTMNDVAGLIDNGLVVNAQTITTSTAVGPLSSTSWAQLANTDVSVTIAGSNSLVILLGSVTCSAATGKYCEFRISDTSAPTTPISVCARGLFKSYNTSTTGYDQTVPIFGLVVNPSVGSHTYRIIYQADSGGSAAMYSDSRALIAYVFRQV